jgi:fatty acid desaturase
MTNLLSWLALIFLTLAGYSAGAVLSSKTKGKEEKHEPSPSLLDTMMIIVLLVGGLTLRLAGAGAWLVVGVWVVVAVVVAFVLHRVQRQPEEGKPLPQ